MAGREVTLCGSKWLCDVVNWQDDVVIRTPKYYKHYTLLQSTTKYYSVLQTLTRSLLCTTKYYSILQRATNYYSVPQSTRKYCRVLLRTIKYYTARQSSSPYYTVLQSIHPFDSRNTEKSEHQESSSNITKYCPCHEKWL